MEDITERRAHSRCGLTAEATRCGQNWSTRAGARPLAWSADRPKRLSGRSDNPADPGCRSILLWLSDVGGPIAGAQARDRLGCWVRTWRTACLRDSLP